MPDFCPCVTRMDNSQLSNLGLLCFVLLRSVVGPENSRHSFNQSNAKLKLITTWSSAFSRALGSLAVWFYFEFSLPLEGIFLLLIGRCEYFGFAFKTASRNTPHFLSV